jgi:hypothetical protein
MFSFFTSNQLYFKVVTDCNKKSAPTNNKGCVTPWALQFTLKSILRQKKNYENSNISP